MEATKSTTPTEVQKLSIEDLKRIKDEFKKMGINTESNFVVLGGIVNKDEFALKEVSICKTPQ